jgi:hypothetical protein
MARPRQGWQSKQMLPDNTRGEYDWLTNRADKLERDLRRKNEVYRCIRLVESGLGQVRW